MTRALPLIAIFLLSLAAPAGAATVAMPLVSTGTSGGKAMGQPDVYSLRITAAPGEVNRMTISGSFRIEDTGAPLTPGDNCRAETPSVVICTTRPATTSSGIWIPEPQISLGDGDDAITGVPGYAKVSPGPGDDEVRSDGPIEVESGPGADLMSGGFGSRLSYAGRTSPVRVTQDGVADDGGAGEGDNVVRGFSHLAGTAAGDELHLDGAFDSSGIGFGGSVAGGDGADRLFGAASNDEFFGGDGDDQLYGADGNDRFTGGAGADLIRGGRHRDQLAPYSTTGPVDVRLDDQPGDGPAGENDDVGSDVEAVSGTDWNDVLIGSDGADTLSAGKGRNHVDGRGGYDHLSGGGHLIGGPGQDTIWAGEGEGGGLNGLTGGAFTSVDAADGESDKVECPSGGPALLFDPMDRLVYCSPAVIVKGAQRIRTTRAGTVRMRLRCERGSDIPCRGELYANADGPGRVGRTAFELPADGSSAVVELRLTRAFRSLLAKRRIEGVEFEAVTRRSAPSSSRSTRFFRALLRPRR